MPVHLLAAAALATAIIEPGAVTGWQPITLHPGVNRVAGFLPGGRTAIIVQGWHANGNAHGWHDWMVLGGPSEGQRFGVVPVEGSRSTDELRDEPFDGERVIGTVRFARGRIAGKVESLLVQAHLVASPSGVLADHATAVVHLSVLRRHPGTVGETTESFVPLATTQTTKQYCNVDLAVRDTLRMPLPRDYAGADRIDGCSG